ncbi:Major Facilitator Superfamily protein [Trichomonas vaginalis G3]|uniref:Major Facilitator Superfamily protein n=1 Tax=Trichomonas vaginalis (strain ATCC PRA-98 / G3) TaxID=412133 RepID=A2D9M3_TRIV3|nr:major facilitator superfamily transporter [Trichomonas vaginalis G3]EAY22879.1 Major Facilitator Superfamily protein [Trichomonas vaginalis G3]KAI5527406.1 Major Facilitator Superfamily (MFS) general substrate transporter family [Trichomonas vaginalis G3]|eukprot:XP_001583865.1 major facilitator superfamily transporter [Trichomonas vaginalis G3]
MGQVNQEPLLITNTDGTPKSNIPWFSALILLSIVSFSTGSINIFGSLKDNFHKDLGFNETFASVMISIGTTLMYFTLPAGIFMDKFGDTITLICSIVFMVIGYLVIFFIPGHVVFCIFFFIAAFGCSSCFISILQIALSRNPKFVGISVSIVSSSLSLAAGLLSRLFNVGQKVFKNTNEFEAGLKLISMFVILVSSILTLIAYFLYRNYQAPTANKASSSSSFKLGVLKDYRLYLLLFTMMFCVTDGMLVILSGTDFWKAYTPNGEGYAMKWLILFSILNMVFTILLSSLFDLLMNKWNIIRTKIFGVIWMIFALIPVLIGIVFCSAHSITGFGIIFSLLGIPFGLGLTMIPAMTSDLFGNSMYGFAFGVVQFGSITSTLSILSITGSLKKTGLTVLLFVVAAINFILGGIIFSLKNRSSFAKFEESSQNDA